VIATAVFKICRLSTELFILPHLAIRIGCFVYWRCCCRQELRAWGEQSHMAECPRTCQDTSSLLETESEWNFGRFDVPLMENEGKQMCENELLIRPLCQDRHGVLAPLVFMIGLHFPRREPLAGLIFTSRRMRAAGGSLSHCIGAQQATQTPCFIQSRARESSPVSRGAMTLLHCYS
jgi:hypothetical protein